MVNFAEKAFWLNDDGSVANVVYTPLDANAPFNIDLFAQGFEEAEFTRNANKAELSQLIFDDDRLESTNDREFGSFQRTFHRDVVQENLNGYVAKNAPSLVSFVGAIVPEQVERFILGKNKNAKTSAFKSPMPNDATDEQRTAITAYNGAAAAVDAYHVEIERMEEQGESAYVLDRLNNLNPMQLAIIMAATGSLPGDPSKIARTYKNFHAATATEAVRNVGIASYVGNNLALAKQLETGHKAENTQLEEMVENTIANLGPGATKEEKANVYREATARKESIGNNYQNAGEDAKYLFTDLANKTHGAVEVGRRMVAEAD